MDPCPILEEFGGVWKFSATTPMQEQQKAERRGRTPQGRQFHAKAEADLKRGNLAGAIQNVQMALTFEVGNAGLKSLLEELRARQKQNR